jgi:hypothetical protein
MFKRKHTTLLMPRATIPCLGWLLQAWTRPIDPRVAAGTARQDQGLKEELPSIANRALLVRACNGNAPLPTAAIWAPETKQSLSANIQLSKKLLRWTPLMSAAIIDSYFELADHYSQTIRLGRI